MPGVVLRVLDVTRTTPRADIVRLDLSTVTFPYRAGQAVLLSLPGAPKQRAYSIACAPGDSADQRCLEFLVGTDAGQPSPFAEGMLVEVAGPIGQMTLPESSDSLTFVAGGTGIAPLRSMLRQAVSDRRRSIRLLYSARTPDDFAYGSELRALASDGRITLLEKVTRSDAPDWSGRRGRIGVGDLEALLDSHATVFVCGPTPMVADTAKCLGSLGVPDERLRIEEWQRAMLGTLSGPQAVSSASR